jgi:NADH dehydrogenase [ubiquinone] 1 alpha subcomplex assembly factor 7
LAEEPRESRDVNALHQEIAAMIAEGGPISLELYMKLALAHPIHGYYRSRLPIGAKGDFITAPEVHQMFGELIGLWAAEVWRLMGELPHVHLVELGPGRGTLMADALRAARVVPRFFDALDVHLVETSETLTAVQRDTLTTCGAPLTWHTAWDNVPKGPVIVIANEFFDALPVRHYVFDGGWRERLVGLAPDGGLAFGLAPEPSPEIGVKAAPGTILELGLAAQEMMSEIATRFTAEPGVLLALDYGSEAFHFGETLQAVRGHRFANVLEDPGQADLTAHVDFSALAQTARRAGAAAYGAISQGRFLTRLGIFTRAAQLAQRADSRQKTEIEAALDRLARPGPQAGPRASMAELFKVLMVTSPSLAIPPGFEADAA